MTMQRRLQVVILLTLALAVVAPVSSGVAYVPPAEPAAITKDYLPIISRAGVCGNGEAYGTMNVPPPVTDRPAHLHGDINFALRSYSATTGTKALIVINGPTDAGAPQLDSLFASDRYPGIKNNYRAHHWIWPSSGGAQPHGNRGGAITEPSVTTIGLQVTPNETIHVPDSNYQISGPPSATYNALVLYAESTRITLKYTSEDSVVSGYTIHIENVCVDPNLVALYQSMNSAGRDFLPALRHGQAIGRAMSDELIVAIRDTGAFMDPRSCKDWWKGYSPC
jgi:hypothetical protein